MASCKYFGKTSGVLLLSAVLLVIAACTPVSAATTNTGDVVSANTDTKPPLRITPYYDDLPTTKAQVREGTVLKAHYNVVRSFYCSKGGDTVVDRSTGADVKCKEEDIIKGDKLDTLKTTVEAAIALHTDRLSVLHPDKQITFPASSDVLCTQFAIQTHKDPVYNTDFLLFVAGAPMEAGDTQAWGTWCGARVQTTRPVAGGVNVAPKYITKSNAALTRLVAREILVALGFGYYTNAISYMTRATIRGTESVPVVQKPTTLLMAQTHFGCKDMKYMELEYAEYEHMAMSYWRGRVMKDDLMALKQTAGYYSTITLAAMADLGFYAVDYTKAEDMPWGRNWGCDFVNKKCVNSDISIVDDVFCVTKPANPPVLTCTTDRYALGVCDLTTYQKALPVPFRYFTQIDLGGAQYAMDYCPIIASKEPSTLCSTGPNGKLPNFVFGEQSRCLDIDTEVQYDANTKAKGVCAKVTCDDVKKTYTVTFSDNNAKECTPGTEVILPEGNPQLNDPVITISAKCPPYKEVCRTTPDYPIPEPHHSSSSHHGGSSHHSSSKHHSSHHDSALTIVQSVWGVTLSLAMVLFMTM